VTVRLILTLAAITGPAGGTRAAMPVQARVVRDRPTRDDLVTSVVDCAAELTEPYDHAEPYAQWPCDKRGRKRRRVRVWRTHHACLIDQLADALDPAFAHTDDSGPIGARTPDGSEPVALAALAALDFIANGAGHWLDELGVRDQGVGRWWTLHGDIRRVVAEARHLDDRRLRRLAAAVCLWREVARHYTGWDRRPWAPAVHCPHCGNLPGERAGLRVWLDRREARCLSCGTDWIGDGPLAKLGEMIAEDRARGS
jgi:hypothetical protein